MMSKLQERQEKHVRAVKMYHGLVIGRRSDVMENLQLMEGKDPYERAPLPLKLEVQPSVSNTDTLSYLFLH